MVNEQVDQNCDSCRHGKLSCMHVIDVFDLQVCDKRIICELAGIPLYMNTVHEVYTLGDVKDVVLSVSYLYPP